MSVEDKKPTTMENFMSTLKETGFIKSLLELDRALAAGELGEEHITSYRKSIPETTRKLDEISNSADLPKAIKYGAYALKDYVQRIDTALSTGKLEEVKTNMEYALDLASAISTLFSLKNEVDLDFDFVEEGTVGRYTIYSIENSKDRRDKN